MIHKISNEKDIYIFIKKYINKAEKYHLPQLKAIASLSLGLNNTYKAQMKEKIILEVIYMITFCHISSLLPKLAFNYYHLSYGIKFDVNVI